MFRVASRKSLQHGLRSIRKQSNQQAPPKPAPSASKKSGGGGFRLAVAGLTAATGGVVAYAYVDPEFRQKVETAVPPAKDVFDKILGEATPGKKTFVAEVTEQIRSVVPKKKTEEVLPPLAKIPPPAPIERKPAHVDPVDVRKTVDVSKPTPELAALHNKQLEQSIFAAIQSAEAKVHVATEAKMKTFEAINAHALELKSAVDNAQNAKWENVTSALQTAESLARHDGVTEVDGRNYIDNLRKVISEGKSNPDTAMNPLLINATETANKLTHQLDELNGLVKKARRESSVLNQYKDLIDHSRQQFALEMKSILPDVDVHAKDKNLTEDELNALIAHAHLKVDQLRRQLTDQQVREEQHIARALEEQRHADERIAADKLSLELNRVQLQQQVEIDRAILSNRNTWNTEMEDQLKRTAAAHSEHLEQVIRTQRQLFEIEHNQKVEEALNLERDHHSRAVGAALSRLEGIESALSSRIALDAENRTAKQFWIACHNLIDTIRHGKKAGNDMEQRRFPLEEPLKLLKEVNPEDGFANAVISSFPTASLNKGVYTEQDLRNRFDKLYRVGRRTAQVGENGTSLTGYMWSYVRSLFLVDLPRRFSEDDKVDPHAVDNIEVLARAKWYVDNDDFAGAVRVIHLLRGEPALLARDWIKDTQSHLESIFLAQLLVAHAAVTSIRSTY